MGLPKQVKEAGDRADALIEEVTGKKPEAVETPPAAAAGAEEAPAPQEQRQPDTAVKQQRNDDLEHKYSVLQGKYNTELPRATQERDNLAKENAELKRLLAEKTAQEQNSEIDEILESYPDDIANIMRRIPALEQRLANIESQSQGLSSSYQEINRDRFTDKLARLIPNWREIDADPNFIEWLKTTRDPESGRVRMQNLTDAQAAGDVDRVAYLFGLYSSLSTNRVNESVNQGMRQPTGNQPPVMPPNSGANFAPQTQAPTFRREEIPLIYAAATKRTSYIDADGRHYSPDEITRLLSDIEAADREGRIIG